MLGLEQIERPPNWASNTIGTDSQNLVLGLFRVRSRPTASFDGSYSSLQ